MEKIDFLSVWLTFRPSHACVPIIRRAFWNEAEACWQIPERWTYYGTVVVPAGPIIRRVLDENVVSWELAENILEA